MALGACLGNGNGTPGGPNPPDPTDFAARFDAAIGLGPTTDLPVAGRANYEGQVQVNIPGAPLSQTEDVTVLGDVTLEVDYAAGNASVLDGIAQNFAGTLSDSTTAELDGFLLLTAAGSQLRRTDLPAPVSGSTGTLSALYEGQLGFDGTNAAVDLTLQGPALGAGGAAFAGAANASVDYAPGEGTDFIANGGQFYLERQ